MYEKKCLFDAINLTRNARTSTNVQFAQKSIFYNF